MNLIEEYKEKALKHGACKEGLDEIRPAMSKDSFAKLAEKYVEFCIDSGYPTNEEIKRDFGDVINANGIYVDQKAEINAGTFTMLCGDCDALIHVKNMSTIYVRHNSKAVIKLEIGGRAFVNVYDDSQVIIDAGIISRAYVYDYGHKELSYEGDVRYRDRKPDKLD